MKDAGEATSRCLTYVSPGRAELREWPALLCDPAGEMIALHASHSGISRGTERLVLAGAVPESEHQRMRAPFQKGDFPFPVAYGYAWVGHRDGAPGRAYFGLFPHQERIVAPVSALVPLPEGLPAGRAILGANMETALNIAWDSGVGPGDRVAVVGGGILGLLVAGILSDIPGAEVTVVDLDPARGEKATAMGAGFALPHAAPGDRDVVIHTSASESGLATALGLAGVEATVVEASWYGTARPALPLGEAFHSRRLTLRSSQVGMVAPSRRPRWSHKRRLEAALGLLVDVKYETLITDTVAFEDLPRAIGGILDPASGGLATIVAYC